MDEKIKQTVEEMELVMHNSFGCRYFNTKEMILNNDRFFNREATALYNAGYRKESDTAKEILKWLVGNKHLFNRTHEIGFEKPRTSYLIMSDEIEELAEKYGVDLGE